MKEVNYIPKISTDVMEYHFDDFKTVHQELDTSLKHAEELLIKQEEYKNATIAFTVNGEPVRFQWLVYTISILVLVINLSLLALFLRRRSITKAKPDHLGIELATGTSELKAVKRELQEHNDKLDILLQTASDLETTSIMSRQSQRKPR